MKKVQLHNTLTNFPWHVWGCMSIALMIPLAKKSVPLFITLLGFYLIVLVVRSRQFYIRDLRPSMWLSAAMMGLLVVGISISHNTYDGWMEIGIKASWFVFPILAMMMPNIDERGYSKVIQSFVIGCFGFIVFAVIAGIVRSMHYNDWSYLSYEKLGYFLHPTYAAMYQSIALFYIIREGTQSWYIGSRRWLHWTLGALIVIFISMLASKAGLISAAIAISLGAFTWWRHKFSLAGALAIWMGGMILLAGSSFYLPTAAKRIEGAVIDLKDQANHTSAVQNEEVTYSSTAIRLITWNASWQILQEHPFGSGTGNTQDELNKHYLAQGETYAAERNLNSHNQFLQTAAELGWPGLILLLLLFWYLLMDAIRFKDPMTFLIWILFGVNCLFESMLEVQAGIVFFCFWLMIQARRLSAAS